MQNNTPVKASTVAFAPSSAEENETDSEEVCNDKLDDLKMDRQTKVSSLKTLDLSEKSSIQSSRIMKSESPSPIDSTVVAEFQRLRRLRRRHSESNLLRNESGLPGIASKGGPHRQHGLSSSLNSSGSTLSVNSSPGASNSEGEAILEMFLNHNPNTLKTLELPKSSADRISPASPVSQRAPRPMSPGITCQLAAPLSPSSMSPTAGSPLSPVSPRSLSSLSPVSPRIPLPLSPSNRRKPSPLTLEDPRALSRSPATLRPIESSRSSLPDTQANQNSPQRTSADDLPISPKNQRRRINSGSKQYETTLQDIVENLPGKGDDLLKKRLAQHPRKMLVRRNTDPPNGLTRRLRMAGLASDENKGSPQGRITQEILTERQSSCDSIPISICEDDELKEKCLNWLDTLEDT